MLSELDRVTDDAGVEFVLGQKIAEGAQGAVFRVEGHPGYAIKLLDRLEDLYRIAAAGRCGIRSDAWGCSGRGRSTRARAQ